MWIIVKWCHKREGLKMKNNVGGFGSWLQDMVKNANTTTNSQKANEIKKKLLKYGIIGLVVGIVFIITGIILFSLPFGDSAFDMSSFDLSGIGMALFMLGGFILAIGSIVLKAGLAIVITGVGTKILDVKKEDRCPKCNDIVDDDEMYCNKCGFNLRENKLCPYCNTQNDLKDEFCRKCGKKL